MTIAIVGAGPAGVIAATLLAVRGEDVTLIDENPAAGGHLRYDRYESGVGKAGSIDWLTELQSALESSGAEFLESAIAWATFPADGGFELAINHSGVEQTVRADQLVVAAGTTDLPLVAPGATLPGVMTSRALRILLNRHGVIPGQRFVVVGRGSEADRMQRELKRAECEVTAVVAPEEVGAIAGESGVESVRGRDGFSHTADVVVVAIGEVPDLQLAGMLEIAREYDPQLRGWRIAPGSDAFGVHVAGGALLGPAHPADVVRSAVAVADRICPAGAGLREAGLAMSADILGTEAVR
jgi:thioredoxin reductase